MSEERGKIRRDLIMATFSHLVQKVVGYVVISIMAHNLAKETMGAFFFAGSIAWMLAMVTDLGTHKTLTRHVAEQPTHALQRLAQVLALRLTLMTACYALLIPTVFFLQRDFLPVMLLTCAYVFLFDLYFTFSSVFLGLRQVKWHVATGIAGQVVLAALVIVAVMMQGSLIAILAMHVIAAGVLLAITATVTLVRIGRFGIDWNLRALMQLVGESLPFFILTLLTLVHFKVDTLMLGFMRSFTAVATYEAAYKVLEVSRFVVRPAAMVFFPLCTALAARGEWGPFSRVMRRLLLTAGGMGFAATVIVFIIAPFVIQIIFGRGYADSVPVLRILYLTVPAVFISFVAAFLANALYLERRAVIITGVCVVINVGMNLAAIPVWGPIGAAWTTFATETLLAVWLVVITFARLRELGRVTPPGSDRAKPSHKVVG